MKNVNDVIEYLKMKNVRNVVINNITWFSLLDVCKVLNLKYNSGRNRCLQLTKKTEWGKAILRVDGPYNSTCKKEMLVINVAGLSNIIKRYIYDDKLLSEIYYAINGRNILSDDLKYNRLVIINDTLEKAFNVAIEASISVWIKDINTRNNIITAAKDRINNVINFATNDKVVLNICRIIYRRVLLSHIYALIKEKKNMDSYDILTYISNFNKNIELKLNFILKIVNIKTYDISYDNHKVYLTLNTFEYKFDLI